MKKKNIIIITSISIVLLCLGMILIFNHHKSQPNDEWETLYNIKSTKDNPIKDGDIEVVNIDVVQRNGQVKTVFTIKNTSYKKVEGIFLCFELLDENKEPVTVVAKNISETIPAQSKRQYEVYITLPDEKRVIKYAEIESVSHQTKESVEEDLDEQANSFS